MRNSLRRLALVTSAAALLAVSCATDEGGDTDLKSALPTSVPAGTSLSVSVRTARVALEASGELGKLPFTVSAWPAVSAGPDVIQAFRGGSVDVATNAGRALRRWPHPRWMR
ncbi:hypothetical protein [Nocardia exalbida]|uniref:hypothetical protein n=1 Tax=Nocardia exalbida TaxID=290231 RepID=UPI001FDFAB8F|nr:hypothetical protein [Nocardia exalbida]